MSSTAEGHSFLVSGKCDAKKTPLTRFRGRLAIAEMGGEGSDMAIEVNCCIFIKYFRRVAYYCWCFHFIREMFLSLQSHMLIKRNFSFPLGPSLPVKSKTSVAVLLYVCKTKIYSMSLLRLYCIQIVNNQLRFLPRKRSLNEERSLSYQHK